MADRSSSPRPPPPSAAAAMLRPLVRVLDFHAPVAKRLLWDCLVAPSMAGAGAGADTGDMSGAGAAVAAPTAAPTASVTVEAAGSGHVLARSVTVQLAGTVAALHAAVAEATRAHVGHAALHLFLGHGGPELEPSGGTTAAAVGVANGATVVLAVRAFANCSSPVLGDRSAGRVQHLRFCRSGEFVVVKTAARLLWLHTSNGRIASSVPGAGFCFDIAVSTRADLVASTGGNRMAVVRRQTGAEVLTNETTGKRVCITSDDRFLAVAAGKTVEIWSLADGERVHVLRGHRRVVTALAASHDGNVVSGAEDSATIVWDPKTGGKLASIPGYSGVPHRIAASRDHVFLAQTDSGRGRVASSDPARRVQELPQTANADYPTVCVSACVDAWGRTAVTAGRCGTVFVHHLLCESDAAVGAMVPHRCAAGPHNLTRLLLEDLPPSLSTPRVDISDDGQCVAVSVDGEEPQVHLRVLSSICFNM